MNERVGRLLQLTQSASATRAAKLQAQEELRAIVGSRECWAAAAALVTTADDAAALSGEEQWFVGKALEAAATTFWPQLTAADQNGLQETVCALLLSQTQPPCALLLSLLGRVFACICAQRSLAVGLGTEPLQRLRQLTREPSTAARAAGLWANLVEDWASLAASGDGLLPHAAQLQLRHLLQRALWPEAAAALAGQLLLALQAPTGSAPPAAAAVLAASTAALQRLLQAPGVDLTAHPAPASELVSGLLWLAGGGGSGSVFLATLAANTLRDACSRGFQTASMPGFLAACCSGAAPLLASLAALWTARSSQPPAHAAGLQQEREWAAAVLRLCIALLAQQHRAASGADALRPLLAAAAELPPLAPAAPEAVMALTLWRAVLAGWQERREAAREEADAAAALAELQLGLQQMAPVVQHVVQLALRNLDLHPPSTAAAVPYPDLSTAARSGQLLQDIAHSMLSSDEHQLAAEAASAAADAGSDGDGEDGGTEAGVFRSINALLALQAAELYPHELLPMLLQRLNTSLSDLPAAAPQQLAQKLAAAGTACELAAGCSSHLPPPEAEAAAAMRQARVAVVRLLPGLCALLQPAARTEHAVAAAAVAALRSALGAVRTWSLSCPFLLLQELPQAGGGGARAADVEAVEAQLMAAGAALECLLSPAAAPLPQAQSARAQAAAAAAAATAGLLLAGGEVSHLEVAWQRLATGAAGQKIHALAIQLLSGSQRSSAASRAAWCHLWGVVSDLLLRAGSKLPAGQQHWDARSASFGEATQPLKRLLSDAAAAPALLPAQAQAVVLTCAAVQHIVAAGGATLPPRGKQALAASLVQPLLPAVSGIALSHASRGRADRAQLLAGLCQLVESVLDQLAAQLGAQQLRPVLSAFISVADASASGRAAVKGPVLRLLSRVLQNPTPALSGFVQPAVGLAIAAWSGSAALSGIDGGCGDDAAEGEVAAGAVLLMLQLLRYRTRVVADNPALQEAPAQAFRMLAKVLAAAAGNSHLCVPPQRLQRLLQEILALSQIPRQLQPWMAAHSQPLCDALLRLRCSGNQPHLNEELESCLWHFASLDRQTWAHQVVPRFLRSLDPPLSEAANEGLRASIDCVGSTPRPLDLPTFRRSLQGLMNDICWHQKVHRPSPSVGFAG